MVVWPDTWCEFRRTDLLVASGWEYKWENQLWPLPPLKEWSRTQCAAPPEAGQTQHSNKACWEPQEVYSLDIFASFSLQRLALLTPIGSAGSGQLFWITDPSWLEQTSAFHPDTAASGVRTASQGGGLPSVKPYVVAFRGRTGKGALDCI